MREYILFLNRETKFVLMELDDTHLLVRLNFRVCFFQFILLNGSCFQVDPNVVKDLQQKLDKHYDECHYTAPPTEPTKKWWKLINRYCNVVHRNVEFFVFIFICLKWSLRSLFLPNCSFAPTMITPELHVLLLILIPLPVSWLFTAMHYFFASIVTTRIVRAFILAPSIITLVSSRKKILSTYVNILQAISGWLYPQIAVARCIAGWARKLYAKIYD